MLEVEPTGQKVAEAGNDASKTFARWLHHRYAPVKLPSAQAYRFAARYLVHIRLACNLSADLHLITLSATSEKRVCVGLVSVCPSIPSCVYSNRLTRGNSNAASARTGWSGRWSNRLHLFLQRRPYFHTHVQLQISRNNFAVCTSTERYSSVQSK